MSQKKSEIYINRELSWLQFNNRVLEESTNLSNPLFERLKFWGIYHSNLDEFYMVRVGSLYDQTCLDKVVRDSRTDMTAKEQIDAINHFVKNNLSNVDKAYTDCMKLLGIRDIEHADINKLHEEEKEFLKTYFHTQVLPLLSPQIIDKHHPFPFLENKKIYIGIEIASDDKDVTLGVIPIDQHFDSIVFIPNKYHKKFVLIEDVISLFLHKVFKQKNIVSHTIFRITRNADINVEDDIEDVDFNYRDVMQELLKKRRKLAPVRLQIYKNNSSNITTYLQEKLHLSNAETFIRHTPLDASFVFDLPNHIPHKPHLFFKPQSPRQPLCINPNLPVYTQVLEKDLLLHYPFESMKEIIRLLDEALTDPNLISIKITLYRMAKNSKIINSLIRAAEKGIDVSVVVELRARFDEENNIEWSKLLEEAGCKVIYGIPNYKVHSKLLLLTRKVGNKINYITHIGTGNFNEKTAKLYTDFALLTANEHIGIEASMLFTSLFLGEFIEHTEHLLVSPKSLKNKILKMMDVEIAYAKQGKKARIVFKINSLTDKAIMNKLVEASQSGVEVNLIVRGICCLRSGVADYTDQIRIVSIVGRFLEHSRIYVFGTEDRTQIYISSADFMTRNTEKRVEVATPIYDKENKARLLECINIMLRDNVKARQQLADGTYKLVQNTYLPLDAQEHFYQEAYQYQEENTSASLPSFSSKMLKKFKLAFKHMIAGIIK